MTVISCTISSIAEIIFNLFELIVSNSVSTTNGFDESSIKEYHQNNIRLLEILTKNDVNVVRSYGYFKYNAELIKSFNFIIKPFIIEGQINNVPILTDFEVCINHSLILLEILSPKSIKWHTHKYDKLHFCWVFEPQYVTNQILFNEEDAIKSDINFIKTLYYCITCTKISDINDRDAVKQMLNVTSGLLTWSLISLYEKYSSEDVKLFQPNNYCFKVDIYGNIVNIAKESCMIYPICSTYPKCKNVNSDWQYLRYIFYNIYNNKIFSNQISKNIEPFAIKILYNLLEDIQATDTNNIPIVLRLIYSGGKNVKLSCYQYLIKYLSIYKIPNDKYIKIILENMNYNFPTSESQLSLLYPFMDCYITLLTYATHEKTIYDGISTIIDNLWDIRNINNMPIKVLKIYIKLVEYWETASFLHLEKIKTLTFNILEPENTNSIIYDDISYGLETIVKLLNIYKGDIKHYCYDIYYRLWNIYVTIKFEYVDVKVKSDSVKINVIPLIDLLDKIRQITRLCNTYFTGDYCKKCIDQLKLQVQNTNQLSMVIEDVLSITTEPY